MHKRRLPHYKIRKIRASQFFRRANADERDLILFLAGKDCKSIDDVTYAASLYSKYNPASATVHRYYVDDLWKEFFEKDHVYLTYCPSCCHELASDLTTCIHCGSATLFNQEFSFREQLISWYSCLVPRGQFTNVIDQLRDDYDSRLRVFGCDKSEVRKANLWLIVEICRDVLPLIGKVIAWAGGTVGVTAVVRWILRRDD